MLKNSCVPTGNKVIIDTVAEVPSMTLLGRMAGTKLISRRIHAVGNDVTWVKPGDYVYANPDETVGSNEVLIIFDDVDDDIDGIKAKYSKMLKAKEQVPVSFEFHTYTLMEERGILLIVNDPALDPPKKDKEVVLIPNEGPSKSKLVFN